MIKRPAKIIDLAERRERRKSRAAFDEFMRACMEAADKFPLYVLDADRNVVRAANIMAWGEFKRDFVANCRVARDTVGERDVSTVFLGTDCSYGFNNVPVVFETMIFGPGQSDVVDRYETWAQAEAGHAAVVRELQNARTA